MWDPKICCDRHKCFSKYVLNHFQNVLFPKSLKSITVLFFQTLCPFSLQIIVNRKANVGKFRSVIMASFFDCFILCCTLACSGTAAVVLLVAVSLDHLGSNML